MYDTNIPIVNQPWFNRIFNINFKYESYHAANNMNYLSSSKFKIVTHILRDLFNKKLITFQNEALMFLLNPDIAKIKDTTLESLLSELNLSFKQMLLKVIKGDNEMNAGAVANILFMIFNKFNLIEQPDPTKEPEKAIQFQKDLKNERDSYTETATKALERMLKDGNLMIRTFANKNIEDTDNEVAKSI